MSKYVVVRQSFIGITIYGKFNSYDEANKYKDFMVNNEREVESIYGNKGGTAFFVTPLTEPKPEVLTDDKKCGCCKHGR